MIAFILSRSLWSEIWINTNKTLLTYFQSEWVSESIAPVYMDSYNTARINILFNQHLISEGEKKNNNWVIVILYSNMKAAGQSSGWTKRLLLLKAYGKQWKLSISWVFAAKILNDASNHVCKKTQHLLKLFRFLSFSFLLQDTFLNVVFYEPS